MKFLITGGAGYIGSHTCVELINQGHKVVIVDSFSNSNKSSLEGISKITGHVVERNSLSSGFLFFYEVDIRNKKKLKSVFINHKIDAVFHFSGYKSVSDSIENPIQYYSNSVESTVGLLKEMEKSGVKTIIYSSSATVYGDPKSVPITEDSSTGDCANPYGRGKYFTEEILKDLYKSDPSWRVAILRYFNPVGAHHSYLIGENPNDTPANLMPYISQVASRKIKELKVFGDDYPTLDGTGVRDYIHVVDLAKGHIAALNTLLNNNNNNNNNMLILNLGTGNGVSVLQLVKSFEKVNNVEVPYKIIKRREGDVAECWASIKYTESRIGWKAYYGIDKMCKDSWNWQKTMLL